MGEAQAVYDLLRYLFSGTDAVPDDRARSAAVTLAHRAHTRLGAGFDADRVTEWWPDNPVAVLERHHQRWFPEDPASLTDMLAGINADTLPDLEDPPLNPTGQEALGVVPETWGGGRYGHGHRDG